VWGVALLEILTTIEISARFGKTGSFIDDEGFPFPETDLIIATKTKRGQLACLQNDLISIMKQIEKVCVTIGDRKKVDIIFIDFVNTCN
jgi:hypothetical protein